MSTIALDAIKSYAHVPCPYLSCSHSADITVDITADMCIYRWLRFISSAVTVVLLDINASSYSNESLSRIEGTYISYKATQQVPFASIEGTSLWIAYL